MSVKVKTNMPELFGELMELDCLWEKDVRQTSDGFFAAVRSVADILACRDIATVPSKQGGSLMCSLFFDDWYLYAVPGKSGFTYGLFKMREQEQDAKLGLYADGDTPGVSISFIALQTACLVECLKDPSEKNRGLLGDEIDRVAARGGQRHSGELKEYFVRTKAQGAYLIARLYTEHIASFAENGTLAVPERYAADYKKLGSRGRVTRFIEENNSRAGVTVCDHEKICLRDPENLSEYERLAILATHAGNASFYSFAAEVQFHAWFLTWWARVPIPIIGRSPYASAIRADMSIGDAEFAGPTPYYRSGSRLVKKQRQYHQTRVENVGW